MTLQELRDQTAASYGFRTRSGKMITSEEYQAMPEETKAEKAAKAKYSWRADPKLVDKLVRAERAWQPA